MTKRWQKTACGERVRQDPIWISISKSESSTHSQTLRLTDYDCVIWDILNKLWSALNGRQIDDGISMQVFLYALLRLQFYCNAYPTIRLKVCQNLLGKWLRAQHTASHYWTTKPVTRLQSSKNALKGCWYTYAVTSCHKYAFSFKTGHTHDSVSHARNQYGGCQVIIRSSCTMFGLCNAVYAPLYLLSCLSPCHMLMRRVVISSKYIKTIKHTFL